MPLAASIVVCRALDRALQYDKQFRPDIVAATCCWNLPSRAAHRVMYPTGRNDQYSGQEEPKKRVEQA